MAYPPGCPARTPVPRRPNRPARSIIYRRRSGPDRRPDRPPDPREDRRRPRHHAARHPDPRRAAGPPPRRPDPRLRGRRGARSARSTSPSTATTCGCAAPARSARPTCPRRDRRPAGDPRRRRALLRPHDPGRPGRAGRPRPAPRRCSSPCWSTAATGSCRSGPTTSARTSRPRSTRACGCCSPRPTGRTRSGSTGRDARAWGSDTCSRGRPRPRRPRPPCSTPPTEMAAMAGREVKKLPTLRGRTVVNLFYEDSTRTRISFEAAAKRLSRRRDQLLGQGLERLQGGEPQGHRADPAGDGRRRGGHPAPAPPARRTGWPTGSTARSSTPATAPTSTRPRRCWTRTRCAAGTAGSRGSRWRSSATCCTAGSPGPTCTCCTPWARTSRWSRRRRCCRSG